MTEKYLSYIPDQWIYTQGIGVKIGIIDAGFDIKNQLISSKVVCYDNFGQTNINHGTHVMGIMSLTDYIDKKIGSASKANYYLASIPIGSNKGVTCLCSAIEKMLSYNLDVLNMSFSVYSDNDKVKKLLYKMHLNNTIIVSAFSQQLLYPHSYPFVLSAGKQLIVSDSFYSLIQNNKFKILHGTSMQAAFISSVAAISKSYNKNITKDFFINKVIGNQQLRLNLNSRNKQYSLKLK